MKLSEVYKNRVKWIMIYHVQPDSDIVEMVSDKVFDHQKDAWDWFLYNYRIHNFIQPEAVKIHMGDFVISREEIDH